MAYERKGSVTVLMSLVLAAVALLAFVLADVTSIHTFEQNNGIAVNSALKSVLAGYDATLAADYGIYGIDTGTTASTIAADFQKYYSANLQDAGGRKPVITECRLTGFRSVLANGTTEDSILRYMRYRAPIYLVEGLIRDINLTGAMDQTVDFTDNVSSIADSLNGVGDKTQIAGELTDLLRLGEILADIAMKKAAIRADGSVIDPAWIITAETRSSSSVYDNDIFSEMAADKGLPDLQAAGGFFRKISAAMADSRDLVYLASYVTERFDCYGTSGGRYFTGGEIEYILYGSNRKADNVIKVMDRIYLMRFLMNTCDAFAKYKDYDPRIRLVLSAISGSLSAADELQRLYDGKEIGLMPGFDYLKLDYKDHLMLLLLTELAYDKQAVVERIQNLIQVNMIQENPEFRMENYTAAIRVDVTVNVDTLFLKFAGFPGYISKKQVYKGYQ